MSNSFLEHSHSFAKTLEVHDFSLTQKFDYVIDIGVVRQAKNIIIGYSCLLLC